MSLSVVEKINELKRQRKKLVDDMRALLDRAEGENRDLTAEEQEQYDRMESDLQSLTNRIERLERQWQAENTLESRAGEPTVLPEPGAEPDGREDRTNPRATNEYRNAFLRYLRSSHSGLFPDEVRVLQVGTDPEGGYLVPDQYQRQLVEALTERNIMRRLATVLTGGSGNRIVPVVVDYGVAQWIGENQAYPESDAQFSQFTMGAHKLARITRVSEELLNDSAFDIAAFLQDAFARSFGDAEEAAFVNGDG